ncbi:MAG: cupredoxin domain-containing protein [Anaerolineae bacterium]|nr:cupredoxin domain-containing protein [Anaerolineae bacterium]MDK1081776.1 cupredoxin domain-containing protein [Anaerolineae bacterium]
MLRRNVMLAAILILTGALVSACGGAQSGLVGLTPGEVLFDLSVIEIKGATDGIEAPDTNPETLSSGYRFKPPGKYDADNPDKWQVSTYMFSPSALTVMQGDEVTLRTFVINGDQHSVWLEKPDGSKATEAEVVMNRGRQYDITFTASQSGYYTLHCVEHAPTMNATILVLPTGK